MARKNKSANKSNALVQNASTDLSGLEIPQLVETLMALPESVYENATVVDLTGESESIVDATLSAEEVQHIEDAVQADEAPVEEVQAPVDEAPVEDFTEMVKAVDADDAAAMIKRMKDEIAKRKSMEIDKDSFNDNIQRTLKKVDQTLARNYAARVLIAANVEPSFLTSPSREGEHYNVYAMGKLNDLVDGLCGLGLKNAINRAVVRSMFALQKAGHAMTRDIAECAASDKIKVKDKTIEGLLTRHSVGATTAPTQVSSTMRALETLGVVKPSGTKNATVFEILATPQTEVLRKWAEAAAA